LSVQQLVANSLVATGLYSAIALSFWLIYRSGRFFHFAHGATIAFGAYACYVAVFLGAPLPAGIILATVLAGGLGALMQMGVFRPLNHEGAGAQVLLLASLGLYVVVENCLALGFGNGPRSLRSDVVHEGMDILGARLTQAQVALIVCAAAVLFTTWLFLCVSRAGLKLRAVASAPELAATSGIDSEAVLLGTMVAGSALAGLFGVLLALDLDMTPTMGLHPLMMGIIVVIVGGGDRIGGIVLAALLLGLIQNLGAWLISSQWQDAAAFAVLVVFLLFRPEGFLGKKSVKASLG
jgi:branched-chain amino acid transport system permease protein